MKLLSLIKTTVLVALVVSVAACGEDSKTEQQEKPSGVVPKHQINTLKRAKGAEDLILDADKKRQQLLEQQTSDQ